MKHLTCCSALAMLALSPFARGDDPAAAPAIADFRTVVRSAKTRVFPAVIFIKCVRQTHESGKKAAEEVGGSGVIISPTGEALTNWHVVDKAVEVRCLLQDGRAVYAKVRGVDKDTDLALLQLTAPAGDPLLPYAPLGNSVGIEEGDFVMAMGAPWGLSRSVSIGIISSTRRYLPGNSEYSLWLQTDAAISPGNSGGPLVDTSGEVIGINTRGVMFGGDTGFAIPAETVHFVVAQLRSGGEMKWSWTGLQLQPLRDFNRNMYFADSNGVIVAGTDPQSPAREADLRPRDRIIRVNDQPVDAVTEEDLPAVRRILGVLPKGEPARFAYVRDGAEHEVSLVPRAKGRVEGNELDCPRWDLTVKEINQFDNPQLHFFKPEGVFIFGVEAPGNALNSGLQSQDIIAEIDSVAVNTLADVRKVYTAATADLDKKHRVIVAVLRKGLRQEIVLDFTRDFEKE
jgi:serine protease Do